MKTTKKLGGGCLVDLVKLKNPEQLNHLNPSKTLDFLIHGDVVSLESRIPKFHDMLKSGRKPIGVSVWTVLQCFAGTTYILGYQITEIPNMR